MRDAPRWIAGVLSSQKKILAVALVFGLAMSVVAYRLAPKTYKVTTAIALEPQYFQVPLVQDFVPTTYDETEIRSARESVVRRSLNHEYLRDLGTRFGLFKGRSQESVTSWDLDELAKSFEIINASATTFLVNYKTTDPKQGFEIINDFIAHLRSFLSQDRSNMLSKLHAAIQDQLETLSFGKTRGAEGLMASRPDLVREEIVQVKKELAGLRKTYSDRHPRVQELTVKLNQLNQYLTASPSVSKTSSAEKFSGAKLDPVSQELFRDLLKKYHYLSVVMFMDKKNPDSYLVQLQEPSVPRVFIWPKLPIFIAWGLAMGLISGSLLAFARETGVFKLFRLPKFGFKRAKKRRTKLKTKLKVRSRSQTRKISGSKARLKPRINVQVQVAPPRLEVVESSQVRESEQIQ